jgi:two-component system chemotaxis response regulator CheY
VLVLIRSRKLAPTPDRVAVLLQAVDKLREMLQDPGRSNKADIVQDLAALTGLCEQHRPSASGPGSSTPGQSERHLRILLVEDDFACRLLLQTFLSRYGECHVAVNGKEAVDAFGAALEQGTPYDLICMDIMMPVMDGREAVRRIRAIEEAQGVFSTSGVTIIMTTAVDEVREVFLCFKELCDAYVMKPIDLSHLLGHMRSFQLVK